MIRKFPRHNGGFHARLLGPTVLVRGRHHLDKPPPNRIAPKDWRIAQSYPSGIQALSEGWDAWNWWENHRFLLKRLGNAAGSPDA